MTPVFRTFLAVALGVVTVAAAEKAARFQTGAQRLVVLLLGVASFVALCAAGTAIAAAVWFGIRYALYERRLAARIRECAPPPSLAEYYQELPILDPVTLARDARLANEAADTYAVRATHARREAGLAQPWTPPMAEPVRGGR
ncbi:MAG: hypothetical protein ACJ786_21760 [Catenulispora sp.]